MMLLWKRRCAVQATDIQAKIMDVIRARSGYEPSRKYLGMSHLGECPKRQWENFMAGSAADDDKHRMAYIGYAFESIEVGILTQAGIFRPMRRTLVADFDERLRGHVDGETVDGDLLEIKSLSRFRFEQVEETGRALDEHFQQVQTYMHFGGYMHTEIIYVCREDFRHRVIHVPYSINVASRLVARARKVLAAIDAGQAPECESARRCHHAGG